MENRARRRSQVFVARSTRWTVDQRQKLFFGTSQLITVLPIGPRYTEGIFIVPWALEDFCFSWLCKSSLIRRSPVSVSCLLSHSYLPRLEGLEHSHYSTPPSNPSSYPFILLRTIYIWYQKKLICIRESRKLNRILAFNNGLHFPVFFILFPRIWSDFSSPTLHTVVYHFYLHV